MAALPPAGVSLQAQGFRDYIRKLNEIEKKQREIFDRELKGTGLKKSFNEVQSAAKQYERQLEKTKNAQERLRVNQENARQATVAQSKAFATNLVTAVGAATAAFAVFAVENAKLAARFKSQQTGLTNLAASFGQSGSEIQAAIQSTSRGTISGLDAIQAANQALLLGVAKTPREFEKLTRVALTLGRTMGLTGAQAIEQFTTALGRRSLLILDNFGISAKQVNAEIEQIAQTDFGQTNAQLNEAQKNAVFMEAALNIASEAAENIGEEAGKASEAFERFNAQSENLRVTFGEAFRPGATEGANLLSGLATTAQQVLAFISAGAVATGEIIAGTFRNTQTIVGNISAFIRGEPTQSLESFGDILDKAGVLAIDRFKEVASTIEGVSFETDQVTGDLKDQEAQIIDNTEAIKSYTNIIRQAEQLQLAFGRAAEDSTRRQLRAQEDVSRKQGRQAKKLGENQTKDRDKLLKNQQKQLDNFETDRIKQIKDAEKDISRERQRAADQRLRDQQRLQQQIKQAQDRFNLSQIQGERRFQLADRRLRAEGDILGLQQLREDRELQQQEEKENFSLSQRQTENSAKTQQKEQVEDFDQRLRDLKGSLESQRGELLTSFDEQLAQLQESQVEQRAQLQQNFTEQAEDRAIALQRSEEDRRISQARQLEDLGRSLAEQEGVTEEGTKAIADKIGLVFGQDGVADNIFKGFSERTKSDFEELFKEVEDIIKEPVVTGPSTQRTSENAFGNLIRAPLVGGIPEFDEGGIVGGPGPVGSPQAIMAHRGETVLPTHKQSFTMSAPIIPSQQVSVEMSGGFNVTSDNLSQATEDRLVERVTDDISIAVKRLARRNN